MSRSSPGWDVEGTRRLLRLAESVNANSRWTKRSVEEHCPEASRASVIPYGGVDRGRGLSPAPRVPVPYILCAARLAEYKGQDILAMAFARLLDSGSKTHLVLCGEDCSNGALARFCARLGIASRVHWLGRLPHGQTLSLMRGSRFVVLPSRREGLGMSAVEALSLGKPVVVSSEGGFREIVRHGKDGFVVRPEDVDSLARAMMRLDGDAGLRRRMGRSAAVRGRAFTWESAKARYGRSYKGKAEVVVWGKKGDATTETIRSSMGPMRGRPDAWHVFLLRYRGLAPLIRFFEVPGRRLVLTLA